ncbi:MAG: prenyltransferase/squalene oxidase repeat-containing protein [Candidatus Thorarchaeota archaeon]
MKATKALCVVLLTLVLSAIITAQPVAASPSTRLDSVYSFLSSKYNKDGSGGYARESLASRAPSTYSAIYSLDKLGYLDSRPPIIDLVKVMNFTRWLQWKSGGESHERYGGFSEFVAGPVSIATSFAAVSTVQLLKRHSDVPNMQSISVNYTSLLVFVNKTRVSAGGFGSAPGRSADMLSTYMAISLIKTAVEELSSSAPSENLTKWLPNRDNLTQWILSCRVNSTSYNGFKLSPASKTPGITPTASALMALSLLGQLDSVADLTGIGHWIIDRQANDTLPNLRGGFMESVATNDTNLISTYYALKALSLIPGIVGLDSDASLDFVLRCQAADGSWSFTPGMTKGDIDYIYMAVESILLLNRDPRTALLVEDPNSLAPPLVDWRIVFVIGFLVVGAAVGIVSVRRD